VTGHSRRRFVQGGLGLISVGLASGCGLAPPPDPQPTSLRRIGFLEPGTLSSSAGSLKAFSEGLREFGYVDGRNITLELRVAEGREEPLPDMAADLVGLKADVIVTRGPVATRTVQQATNTIPIIFATADDPIADGLVKSLARPGGNTTGLTVTAGQEHAKRIELLKHAVPSLSRVGVLWWRQSSDRSFRETGSAARALGVEVLSLELQTAGDLASVLATATSGHADGLVLTAGALFSPLLPSIVDFATRNRLPSMSVQTNFPGGGGLMAYGPNVPENHRRAAGYVDKILKGANPGDLPVEQPARFDLVVNLKTAQALGLTMPQSVLQQATEVIQ